MWYCQLSRVFFKVAIITLGFQRSDDDTILTEETEWLAQTKSSLQPWLASTDFQTKEQELDIMMDSNSELVVKEKHRFSISICIPLTGKVVSFLSNWNQPAWRWRRLEGWKVLFPVLAGVGSPPASCHRPLPSLPTNYSDMNFPVPDFWQAPLMMLIRDDERSTQC